MVERTQGGKACETSTMWKGNTYQVLFCNVATCWFHIAENAAQVRKGFRYLGCCFKGKKKTLRIISLDNPTNIVYKYRWDWFLKMYVGLQLPWALSRFHLKPDGEASTPGCKLAGLIHKGTDSQCLSWVTTRRRVSTPVCQNLKHLHRVLKWVWSLIPSR